MENAHRSGEFTASLLPSQTKKPPSVWAVFLCPKGCAVWEATAVSRKILSMANNMDMAHSAVEMLAENYKTMFALDNARNILLDLAKEYLQGEKTTLRFFGI